MDKEKKRKRLSYGLVLKNSGNNELALVENDDEKEKQERRKSRILLASGRKSLARSFGEEDNLFSNTIVPPKNPLSNNQLAELYSICLRLCSENKINTKNTWSLDLIDYIDDVLDVHKGENVQDGPGTNFQAASATLDASIKIYSSRVDSVYSEAYKVAGGLTNENDDESQEINESTVYNSVEQDDEEEVKEKKKRVKRTNRATNTLCTNDAEITVKKFDLEFSVDPLFRKTSAAFDEGGAKGLLFNHLTIHGSCEIVFDSSEMNSEENNSLDTSLNPIDVTELRDMLYTNQPNLSKLEICPAYVNWTSSDIPEIDLDDIDINFDRKNDDAELEDEDDSASISAYDFGNEMFYEGDMNIVEQPLPMDINDEVNVILDDTEEGKDYSYFDLNKIGGLNGAQHWKFNIEKPKKKRIPKKEVKYDEDGNIIEPKRKSTKKNIKIDFFGKEPEGFEKLFEPAGRSSTTLTKAALAKQEKLSESLLLPEDDYDKENFTKLFLHRSIDPSKTNHDLLMNNINEDETFNEELENFHEMDNDMDMNGTYPINDFDYELDGDIAKPRHQAEALKINYAKVDKKVDVKALKNTIWNELSKPEKDEVKEERSFQEVLDALPEALPPNIVKEISVPYCFVCLLHLANEKSLSLTQESFDEIVIRQNVNK